MDAAQLRELRDVAVAAARTGGRVLLDMRSRCAVRSKGRNDLVTDADLAAQEAIERHLLGRYPGHAFLGEEGKSAGTLRSRSTERPTWIVDPLDGTTNYAHDIPVFAVSIGLEMAGKLLVGVVFDPCLNEMFHAADGLGAWLGERRLETSRTAILQDCVLSTGFPPDLSGQEHTLEAWRYFSLHAQSLRRTGSTSLNLAYVAAGRHDGFWTSQAWPWDAAAGVVLVREAGGRVTRQDGSDYDLATLDVLASNGPIHGALEAGLRDAMIPC